MIYKLSSSRFSRPYWGNHFHFLFLRLLICLNSAGSLVSLDAKSNNLGNESENFFKKNKLKTRSIPLVLILEKSLSGCFCVFNLINFMRQWPREKLIIDTHRRTSPNNPPFDDLPFDGIWSLSPSRRHSSRSNLKLQYAFSILLIRGILPFTALIAFCCVLHRYPSRGIHR